MKVFRNKKTGKLGETQFKDDANILIRNAKAAGFQDDEIEIIDMTPEAYAKEIAKQDEKDDKPKKDKLDAKKNAIKAKLKNAIPELTGDEINFLVK